VKTAFGYHIIRVDRVQPGEVKVRHILISPVIDSNDVHVAYLRADTAAQLWRKGANFDSLVAKYHDPGEEKGILTPFPLDSLPESYQAAVNNLQAGQVSNPFALQSRPGTPVKYAILRVVARTAAGEYSLPEVRERIRQQLASQRQARDMLDDLRKQTYVSLRM
jgi:peptidyl-prolyl cis-trans isomerase SurA